MGRGYRKEEIRKKLVAGLKGSGTGMSGVELSGALGVNRSTMAKYLKIFAAEGTLRQKDIGNVTLWSLEPGQESYDFPDDYFRAAEQFLGILQQCSESRARALIRNCVRSGASVETLVAEVLVPAASAVGGLFDDGKIGSSEQKFMQNTISDSLHMLGQLPSEPDPRKNMVVISADPQSRLLSEAASSSFRAGGWSVFHLGDMSHAVNVLFDLDFQKLLGKIPRQRPGVTAVAVFSDTGEGLAFFSDSIRSIRQKSRRPIRLALCGEAGSKTRAAADFASDKFGDIVQWSKAASANPGR